MKTRNHRFFRMYLLTAGKQYPMSPTSVHQYFLDFTVQLDRAAMILKATEQRISQRPRPSNRYTHTVLIHIGKNNVETKARAVIEGIHHCFRCIARESNFDLIVLEPLTDQIPGTDGLKAHHFPAFRTLIEHCGLNPEIGWHVEHAKYVHVERFVNKMAETSIGFGIPR